MFVSQMFVEDILEELTDLEIARQDRMFGGKGAGEAAKRAIEKRKLLWRVGKKVVTRR